jgi:hypothetical protein
MNRIAVEIGADRFGHSMNAAFLRDDRFVTDVVSRVLKLKGDLPRVSQILQPSPSTSTSNRESSGTTGNIASSTVSKTTVSCSARLRSM